MMKHYLLCIAAALTSLALALPASSNPGPAQDTVKPTVDKVIAVLNDPAMKGPGKEPARRAKIRAAVFDVFDFGEMAKRCLATYWKDRTPAQKKEFIDLFSDLLERSYINRIEDYTGQKVVYDSEKVDGEYAVVKSHFVTRRGEAIPVDYKLIQENGRWMVYDLVIENVSLVNNYRVQFNKIIRTSSYEELVRKMKNKSESEKFAAPEGGKGGK